MKTKDFVRSFTNLEPGCCIKLDGSLEREKSSLLSITKDGPEMNYLGTAFVIVDFDPTCLRLVPINSNLPPEMTVNLPISSNLEIELVYQGYCMDTYPQRWKAICQLYPKVAKIGR